MNRALNKFLLAQNDSILHIFLEVRAYGVTCDVLDPQPQLLFFLRVILLSNLGGWRGQRSRFKIGERILHAFIQYCHHFCTRSWENTFHLSFIHTKILKKWKNRARFVAHPVCFVWVSSFKTTQFQCIMLLFYLLKNTCTHTRISCLANCCRHPFLSNTGSLFLRQARRGLTGLA